MAISLMPSEDPKFDESPYEKLQLSYFGRVSPDSSGLAQESQIPHNSLRFVANVSKIERLKVTSRHTSITILPSDISVE
jgi:hypothetical protein